MHMLYFGSFL